MVSMPLATPVTTPPVTVATDKVVLVHVPPDAVALKVVAEPRHICVVPEMLPAEGDVEIVTGVRTVAVPQLLVTE